MCLHMQREEIGRTSVNQPILVLSVLVTTFVLAACGGGGGGGSGGLIRPDANILTLIGATAPVETPGAQSARSASIVSRADSLIFSTVYGETTHDQLPAFRLRARCSGITCSITEPRTGYSEIVSLSDMEFASGAASAVGTKNGVTLSSSAGSVAGTEFTAFGAWMHHSGFAVQTEKGTVQGETVSVRYGLAGGDLTGRPPSGSATWRGVMVGTPASGSSLGHRLVGDASLHYDLNAGDLDASFTNIKNIDRQAAHSTATVQFINIPVASDGTFRAGLSGNRIQGGFYGSNHSETAGIFEQSNVLGAFGAQRN